MRCVLYWCLDAVRDYITVPRCGAPQQLPRCGASLLRCVLLPHAQPRGDAALDVGCAVGVPGPPLLVRPPWLLVHRVQDVVVGIPEAPDGVQAARGPFARAAAVGVDVPVPLLDCRKDEGACCRGAAGVQSPPLLLVGSRCRHCSSEAARRQMSSCGSEAVCRFGQLEPVLLA
jgi:hypothetical protein